MNISRTIEQEKQMRMDTFSHESELQVLSVSIPGMNVCLELEYIIQVLQLMALQPLPGSPHFFRGVMNYHGEMAPVIDLAARLGLPQNSKYSLNTPVLLCSYNSRPVGLIVSEIIELKTEPVSKFQMADMFNSTDWPFKGVIQFEDNLSVLLDPVTVLDIDVDINPLASVVTTGMDEFNMPEIMDQ